MKIIFAGTPVFAVPFFESLLSDSDFEIVGIITQPDKPVGRKQILTPSPVKESAQNYNLPIFQPENFQDEKLINKLKNLKPDLMVVVAYGLIIPQEVLNIAKSGNINVHPSLLPKYRGASPIQNAILSGDQKTGVTIMLMDEKMDHGPILAQEEIRLNGDETGKTLPDKLAKIGAPLLIQTIKNYLAEKIQPREQNHNEATFCRLITKDEAKIDWSKPAEEIERKIRAFYPWPAAWTTLDGKRLKIFPPAVVLPLPEGVALRRAEASKASVACCDHRSNKRCPGIKKIMPPGMILEGVGEKDKLLISCDQSTLAISQLQFEGKKQMSTSEFLRGQKDLAGKILT
ncbi:MAG: methionyl-tRNA formyltransferase [Patescibacteria group bacterium]